MKYAIKELAETGSTSTRGSSFTAYALSPIQWLKEILDAAKKRHYFAQFAYTTTAPEGVKDIVIPKRKIYLGAAGTSFSGELTTADISWTTLDTLDGVTITPEPKLAGVAITNYAIRTNAVDLLKAAKEELIYAVGDAVDIAVANALANATPATSSARGAQTIYGGNKTSDANLAAGDVLTVYHIAEARTMLMSTTCYYWSGGSRGVSAQKKNPWEPTDDEPFVLFIAPEQYEQLLKDPQFTNAATFGSRDVVANGEVAQYLGVRIIVTTNVPGKSAGEPGWDGSGNLAVNAHRCMMIKAKKAVALGWGLEPTLKVFDYPNRGQTRIALETAYQAKVVFDDAIVWIDVADS